MNSRSWNTYWPALVFLLAIPFAIQVAENSINLFNLAAGYFVLGSALGASIVMSRRVATRPAIQQIALVLVTTLTVGVLCMLLVFTLATIV